MVKCGKESRNKVIKEKGTKTAQGGKTPWGKEGEIERTSQKRLKLRTRLFR